MPPIEELLLPGPAPSSANADEFTFRQRTYVPPAEPSRMLDFKEVPEGYGKNDCGLLVKDPAWLFVYWEVTPDGIAAARAQLGPSAEGSTLVLRLFSDLDGGAKDTRIVRDYDLGGWHLGRRYLQTPGAGALVRAAIGLLSVEGYFAPIAHSPSQRVPHDGPAAEISTEWMTVLPAKTRGREREPLAIVKRPEHSERGLLVRMVPGGAAANSSMPGGIGLPATSSVSK